MYAVIRLLKFTSNDKDGVMREKTKDSLLLSGVSTAGLLLLNYEHVFIAFSIFFIYSLYKLYPERYLLAKIVKSAFVIRFYNVVVWFISYILTLKTLNVVYGVDEEYLKFSPAIVTIPVSIIVICSFLVFVISVFSAISMATGNIIGGSLRYLKAANNQSTYNRIVTKLSYLMIVSFVPIILAAQSFDYISRIAILSDASFVSDCGVRQQRVMYLRKNNNECYRFILDKNIFSRQPVIINSKK